MTTTTDTFVNTAVQTTEALLPAILAAAGVANPALTSAAQIAPAVISALQLAATFQKSGFMTADQLASLFASIGQGVQSTHDKWAAMNAADSGMPSTLKPQAA
jgi:hypothetical protein